MTEYRQNKRNYNNLIRKRFGKSMALEMLAAYYSCGCDSKKLFAGLKIEICLSIYFPQCGGKP